MADSRTRLTELEGAVLTEVAQRGNRTAFKVRRAFQRSPSAHWTGSAGAVYPAIRRLVAAGILLSETVPGARGTRLLSLSARGEAMFDAWACDPEAACGLGFDPFRLRAGLWRLLPPARQRAQVRTLRARIESTLPALRERAEGDAVDRTQTGLAIEMQLLRLRWLAAIERDPGAL